MTTATAAPVHSCHVPAFFDVVDHMPDCGLMVQLEAAIRGDILNPSDMTDPNQPAYYIGFDGGFYCIPGIDGDIKMVP